MTTHIPDEPSLMFNCTAAEKDIHKNLDKNTAWLIDNTQLIVAEINKKFTDNRHLIPGEMHPTEIDVKKLMNDLNLDLSNNEIEQIENIYRKNIELV